VEKMSKFYYSNSSANSAWWLGQRLTAAEEGSNIGTGA